MPAINLGPMTDFAGLRGDAVLAEAAWVLASTAADDIAVLRSRLDRQYSESRYRSVICVTSLRQPPTGQQERDDFSSNRHPALSSCLSMIFSENRCPLFRIML
jgi:hypothetical protein